MNSFSPLMLLGLLWSVITVILVALIILRAIRGLHEEDRMFLARDETALEKEQSETLRHIKVLDAWIKRFVILAVVLLLAMGAIWAYQGFYGPL